MIYFFFFVASLLACAVANLLVTFTDVYFSGPATGYTLLNGYLPAAKVLFFLMLQIVLVIKFKFYKKRTQFFSLFY